MAPSTFRAGGIFKKGAPFRNDDIEKKKQRALSTEITAVRLLLVAHAGTAEYHTVLVKQGKTPAVTAIIKSKVGRLYEV